MSTDFSAQLRAALASSAPEPADAPAGDTYSEVAALIARVTHSDPPAREAALADLGIESLDLIELAVRAEMRWGVSTDSHWLRDCSTVGDVVDYIEDHVSQ